MLAPERQAGPSLPDELFDPATVAPETQSVNEMLRHFPALPHDIHAIRGFVAQAASAASPTGEPYRSARAIEIEVAAGLPPLRVIKPQGTASGSGLYVHAHGGGWSFGTSSDHDAEYEALADATGFAVASVEYRLAPEFPFPTPLDDCETSIRFAVDGGVGDFAAVVVGGESAGANLALSAVLRMRDAGRPLPAGLVLYYGAYDLTGTPSQRSFGTGFGMVDSASLPFYYGIYAGSADRYGPEISPLYADMCGLPPALVLVGTRDPLLDDSLFLWARMRAARVTAGLHVAAGGAHGFNFFPIAAARAATAAHEEFLRELAAACP